MRARRRGRSAVLLFCATATVAGVLGLTASAYATYHNEPPPDCCGQCCGGLYTRVDEPCPNQPGRESTFCFQSGTELCSVRYC